MEHLSSHKIPTARQIQAKHFSPTHLSYLGYIKNSAQNNTKCSNTKAGRRKDFLHVISPLCPPKSPKQEQERHAAGLLKSSQPTVNTLGNLIIHRPLPKAKQVRGSQNLHFQGH